MSTASINIDNLDRSADPSIDFYLYANGKWLASHPTPPGEFARFGTFEEIAERNRDQLKAIVEDAKPGSQVGDFYRSAMDMQRAESLGMKPILPELQKVNATNTAIDVLSLLGYFHSFGISGGFATSAQPDSKNSNWVLLHFYQSGLSLPDRDYYTLDEKAIIREQYEEHVKTMFELINDADPAVSARHVVQLETALAQSSLTRTERRDPHQVYNKMTIAKLAEDSAIPLEGLQAYLTSVGIAGTPATMDIIVDNVSFFKKFASLLVEEPIAVWRSYLRWKILNCAAPYLSNVFVDQDFAFFAKILNGQQEIKPRWKRVLSELGRHLETPLGQIYVEKHFSAESKKQCLQMVSLLIAALKDRLMKIDWMGQKTKELALKKLGAFGVKIGYPDKWEDYSKLIVNPTAAYVVNVWSGSRDSRRRENLRLNKAVDRTRWEMPPFMVNAYFNPELNEIVFPAAILQPPFFIPPTAALPHGDPAVSFGAIGAVIGHELTHGYDDQGRKYNWEGNLADWWTAEDATAFESRAQVIISQFAGYTVEGRNVNGELTQGENIADLGGVKMAYIALKQYLNANPSQKISVDGFSPEQRFFLSWAQIWRNVICPEAAIDRLLTDPHSPGVYRVNGPLPHLVEFYDAFKIKEKSPMWREKGTRCDIW